MVAFDPPSHLTIRSSSPSRMEVTATRARSPYYVLTGQAFDDRWTATMDGRSLGKPIVVDGYSVGWRIDDLQPHRFVFSFGPQRWVTLAQILSAAALVLILLVFVRPRRGARVDGPTVNLIDRTRDSKRGPIPDRTALERPDPPRKATLVLVAGGALWFVGGWAGLAAGGFAGGVLLLTRRLVMRSGRELPGRAPALAVPAVLLALIPLILFFNGLPPAMQLTPALVRSNMLASYLAEAALVLTVAALFVDVRRHAGSESEPDGGIGPRLRHR
jgi:arabinofuranan 3-O-arabinosyltransferase